MPRRVQPCVERKALLPPELVVPLSDIGMEPSRGIGCREHSGKVARPLGRDVVEFSAEAP